MDTTATITNTSGGSIDRLELNTWPRASAAWTLRVVEIARSSRRQRVRIDDQTLIVPLGGVLAPGATVRVRVIYHATLRTTTPARTGSSRAPTASSSLPRDPVGQPGAPVRAPEPRRPVHHAEQPAGQAHDDRPHDTVAPQRDAHLRLRERPDPDVRRHQRARPADRDGAGLPRLDDAVGDTRIRVLPGARDPGCRLLDPGAVAIQRIERSSGPYPWPVYTVVESAGGYAMEGPGPAWIPRGIAARACATCRARDGAPVAAGPRRQRPWAEPFADEAVADMIARHDTQRATGATVREGRLDLDITATRAPATTRSSTSRAATGSTTCAGGWATAFWGALRDYSRRTVRPEGRARCSTRSTTATPLDSSTLVRGPLFPGSTDRRGGPRASACGIWRKRRAAAAVRHARSPRRASPPPPPAPSPRQPELLADAGRQQRDRGPTSSRRRARHRAAAGQQRGQRRVQDRPRARDRATRRGPGPGPSIAAMYASNASMSPAAARPGSRTRARPGASRRSARPRAPRAVRATRRTPRIESTSVACTHSERRDRARRVARAPRNARCSGFSRAISPRATASSRR